MRRGRPSKNNEGDQTDQHIVMQLRKAVLLNGQKRVDFRNGDTAYIEPEIASLMIAKYNSLARPAEKFEFQEFISLSLEQFLQHAEQ